MTEFTIIPSTQSFKPLLKIGSSFVERRNRGRNQCRTRMPIASVKRVQARARLLRIASVCKLIENNSSAKRMRASSRGKCGRRVRQPEEIPNRIRGPGFVEFRPRRDASICKCARARCGIFPQSLSLSVSFSLCLFSLSPPLHFAFSNWSPGNFRDVSATNEADKKGTRGGINFNHFLTRHCTVKSIIQGVS